MSLTSVELYNRNTFTTAISRDPKRWAINANINSLTSLNKSIGATSLALGLELEYSVKNWQFAAGYQMGLNGSGGVTFAIQRTLFQF